MKTFFKLLTLLLFFYSCQQSKPKEERKKVITETEKFQKINKRIESRLSFEKEKIILLSEVRKVHFDILNLILRDYYVITDTVSSSDKNSKYIYQSAISEISEKYKISKSKIASLIFSFKYEMLSKEEIEESAVEAFKEDYEEEEEAFEPDESY